MDSGHRDLFEQAIAENPDELVAWQAYADWLCEQGNPHGELMHVQMRLEDPELAASERERLQRRFDEILNDHRREILGHDGADGFYLDHGRKGAASVFVEGPVTATGVGGIMRRGWLNRLHLAFYHPAFVALLGSPAAGLLHTLGLNAQAYKGVLRSGRFLRALRAFHCAEIDAELEAICGGMVRLEHLDCSPWNIHAQSLVAALPRLRSLSVGHEGSIGFMPTEGLLKIERLEWQCMDLPTQMFASPFLANVRCLKLVRARGREAFRALRATGMASRLKSLEIGFGNFSTTDDAFVELAQLCRDFPFKLALTNVIISPEAEALLRAACPGAEIDHLPAEARGPRDYHGM